MADPAATLATLLAAHDAVFAGLLAATDDLPDEAWATPTGCPGWDVADQLAHCVGLERRMLGDDEVDPHVAVPDLPHLTDEVKRHLERDVAARRGWPPARLRAEAEETFARRRDDLATLTPDDLAERAVGPMGPMRRSSLLRMRLFDLACHERDVRAALGRLEGLAGPHVDVAVEQAVRGWAALWAGDDQRLRVEVGPARFDLDLAAGALAADDAEPQATVRLTAAEALALAGGRSDAPPVTALAVEGDEAAARARFEAAGMTP